MQTTFFKVISEVSVKSININGMTEHREKERNDRAEKIMQKVGEGETVACFLVDRNHYNGYEKHIIMDNGVLVVVNNRTEKVITTFLASGGQIGRYWRNLGQDMPRELQYLTRIYRKVGRID